MQNQTARATLPVDFVNKSTTHTTRTSSESSVGGQIVMIFIAVFAAMFLLNAIYTIATGH